MMQVDCRSVPVCQPVLYPMLLLHLQRPNVVEAWLLSGKERIAPWYFAGSSAQLVHRSVSPDPSSAPPKEVAMSWISGPSLQIPGRLKEREGIRGCFGMPRVVRERCNDAKPGGGGYLGLL